MRTRALTLCLSLLGGVVLASCSSTYGLTVSWTFANGGSCDGAGIEQVRITIPGEPLQQSIFDCRLGQVMFTGFYSGSYQVTVDALDATVPNPPTPIWTGTGSVDLRGSATVAVVLQPVSAQNAVTYLSWTLDPATGDPNQIPRCGAGQRLDQVGIFIDDQNAGTYGCGQGTGGGVVVSPYVAAGPHNVQLVAFSSQEGVTAYAQSDVLQITFATGQSSTQTTALHWNVGGLQVAWAPYASLSDYNADIRQTCAQAGIADLVLGFATQQEQGSTFSLGASCNASVVLDNVLTGTWFPYIDACGPGGAAGSCGAQSGGPVVYRENPALVNPQTVSVQPGKFFDSTQPAAFNVFIPLFHI